MVSSKENVGFTTWLVVTIGSLQLVGNYLSLVIYLSGKGALQINTA